MRQEQEIFDELAELCTSPGYSHAIASIAFRDTIFGYGEELTAKDAEHLYSEERLIRTEISTLIGLLVRKPVDFTLPKPNVVQDYLDRTERILKELHSSMQAGWLADLDPEKIAIGEIDPFKREGALREPIFYGGESAWSFQYRDLAVRKYVDDNDWIVANKGFDIRAASQIVKTIFDLQNEKYLSVLKSLKSLPPDKWTMLPGFAFTALEVAERGSFDANLVKKFLRSFSLSAEDTNDGFNSLHDFNATNATPLLRRGDQEFLLFQQYSLAEALYESPIFWMSKDPSYKATALKHRGDFTERFVRERLERVFGKKHVYTNIDIFQKKGQTIGEIDVLVLFGDRAIVLQAKSKRLTLEARKGNDLQLKSDFKKAIQDAYDQAYVCATALNDSQSNCVDADGNPVLIPTPLKIIYPVCIVADHYPALNFQARQFLKYQTTDNITPPLVTDVFAVDAITEMLESPLRFLSYLDLRARFGEKLMTMHEHTLLSYHLKRNLWLDDEFDMVVLHDDIGADLDVAMTVRREGLPGKGTPDGILTRFQDTFISRMISEIEARPDPTTIDFGHLLLELNEESLSQLNRGIEIIVAETQQDGAPHDITIGLGTASSGITVHCNFEHDPVASSKLATHCEARKYTQKASTWFGVAISPIDGAIRFGLKLDHPWEFHKKMDKLVADMPTGILPKKLKTRFKKKRKVGRNTPCPCGSGKKYKKCCLGLP